MYKTNTKTSKKQLRLNQIFKLSINRDFQFAYKHRLPFSLICGARYLYHPDK